MEKINKEEFLEELITQYGKLVFSICYRLTKNYFDSEDLAQDTFLSVYKNIDSFHGDNMKAWISKIATNKCLDYLKRGGRNNLLTEDTYFMDIKSKEPTPLEICLNNEAKDRVRDVCKELKPPYNVIAYEHFCKGVTTTELAKQQGKPVKTIRTQVYRAKGMLRELLRKEYL